MILVSDWRSHVHEKKLALQRTCDLVGLNVCDRKVMWIPSIWLSLVHFPLVGTQ
ncbi:MAG: hypothetical protein ACREBR_00835 [bacterium]